MFLSDVLKNGAKNFLQIHLMNTENSNSIFFCSLEEGCNHGE